MAEEKEKNPTLALKEIKAGTTIKIKLDCAAPIATGDGQYGPWYLWVAFVEKMMVFEGPNNNKKKIENYSGKVIFFPTEILNKKLVALCNGNTEVEVEIGKVFEENADGKPITKYTVEKLSDGVPKSGKKELEVTPMESKLMDEVKEFISEGHTIKLDTFLKIIKEPQYKGAISEERAKELFNSL